MSEIMYRDEQFKIFYFQVTDLWKNICEQHYKLFDLTCDEYECLLASKLDMLDDVIKEKEMTIDFISGLENERNSIVEKVNIFLSNHPESKMVKSINDLIDYMVGFENHNDIYDNHLLRFNKLLIDIIEKIQVQNKKNQVFINKAIIELDDIKNQANKNSTYQTYTSMGTKTFKTNVIGPY